MKNSVVFIIFAVAIIAFLIVLSSGKKIPPIPRDLVHNSVATDGGCAACHGPGKVAPLHQSHPPKEQCLLCHPREKP